MPKHIPSPFPFSDAATRPPFDFYYLNCIPFARQYLREEARWRDARDFFLIEAEDAHARIVAFVDSARFHPKALVADRDKLTALERLASTAVHAKAMAEFLGLSTPADPLAPTPSIAHKIRALLRRRPR